MKKNRLLYNPLHLSASVFLSLVFMMELNARAAQTETEWVPTRTKALLVPTAAGNVANGAGQTIAASAIARPSYTMNLNSSPTLANTRVTALEISQPLRITVALKTRNGAQLDKLIHDVNEPGNANYHRFVTPAEFKLRFAPTDAEATAVAAHLKASGFTNIQTSPDNRIVMGLGNAVTVQAAFHVSLKRFTYNSRAVFANDSSASVPSSLGSVVDAVLGLQNVVRPKRLSVRVTDNAEATALDSTPGEIRGIQAVHDLRDFPKIYGASRLPSGSETTVGIITWGDVSQTIADLKTFTRMAEMPPVDTLVVPSGTGVLADDGDPAEWNLDSQSIVAMSGGVKQLIFYSAINGDSSDSELTEGTLIGAMNQAVNDNVAKIINVSLSLDETAENAAGVQAVTDEIFKQAAVQGQTFSVASGDSGVYQESESPQGTPGTIGTFDGAVVKTTIDLTRRSVAWPANSPYVVAVGGTVLSTIKNTVWAGEVVWNDGLFYADRDAQGHPTDNFVRLLATGGGVSLFEAAPPWQKLVLGRSGTMRALPDVAFSASRKSGAWIVVKGKAEMHAGTSLASPLFVGGFARVETAHNNVIGLPTPWLYRNVLRHHSTFHDVTYGNNGYEGHGYAASTGWDNSTGFGSLDFGKLSKVIDQSSDED